MAPGHFGYPIEGFYVYGWSISGNETAVGVKTRGLFVLFDVGIAPTWSISAKHVYLCLFVNKIEFSHGHIDHIGAICQHMRKRELNNIGPATYYLLPHLIEPVKALCRVYSELQGRETVQMYEPKLVEMIAGSRIQIENKWWVESFQTDHVVQSLGYLIFRQDFDTGELIPEIAYTGDTRFTIYTLPAHPKLLQVKLLISESTYLEDSKRSREYSQKYGHICITDFAINSRLFRVSYIFCSEYGPSIEDS
ncbi:unnamed protein product [Hymenolepis diminuta]|uniref:Lactamase_B domain-containing protein n=1 Tax=Hymenolepis diminuta TaxID=6216 RepID=A0A0R3SMR6_HYMDI|nr:unnamed protein product [Hymenolepis diminuta]